MPGSNELLKRAEEDKELQKSEESGSAEEEMISDDKKAKTGGRIGVLHTISLDNGKKQKVIEFFYEGGIKEFVTYLNKSIETYGF